MLKATPAHRMTPITTVRWPFRRECRRSTTFHEPYRSSMTRPTTTAGNLPSTAFYEVCHHRRSSSAVVISAALAMMLVSGKGVSGAEMTTEYLKPSISSKDCVDTVALITAKTEELGNSGACMQCDPANNVCPPGCQALIDYLYVSCDGVTTPDGLFYDPNNIIEGTWSEQVKARIKIATERCGCNSSVRLQPVSLLQGPFDLSQGPIRLLLGSINLMRGSASSLRGIVSLLRGPLMVPEGVSGFVLAAGRVGVLVGTIVTTSLATWLATCLLL